MRTTKKYDWTIVVLHAILILIILAILGTGVVHIIRNNRTNELRQACVAESPYNRFSEDSGVCYTSDVSPYYEPEE